MNKLSSEEFLRLINNAMREVDNYSESYDDEYMPESFAETIPEIDYESYIEPKKEFQPKNKGWIDLTNNKKDTIHKALFECPNIKVGKFMLIIKRYNGDPSTDGAQITMDIRLMETRTRTPTGNPCKMDYDVITTKDSRFKDRPWLSYFHNGATKIPSETIVDIVKWLQIITKMSAFL